MPEVYLVDGVRTPQGRYGGALAGVRPDDLAALVVGEVVRRAGVPADAVDEVILGAANQAGEDNRNVARMAVAARRAAGHRPRLHGQPAVRERADRGGGGRPGGPVRRGRAGRRRRGRVDDPGALGDGQAGHPVGAAGRGRRQLAGLALHQPAVRRPPTPPVTLSMGETAEEVAALDGITRADSDAFALRSHQRAVAATDAGPLRRRDRAGAGARTARSPPTRARAGPPRWRQLAALRPVVPRRRRGHRRLVLAAVRRRGRDRGGQRARPCAGTA